MMTTIALFGAGGKMGCRLSANLENTDFKVRHVEVSEAGRKRLADELGIACVDEDAALDGADVVILAVPDVAIGKAYGAISFGQSSRKLGERAETQAYFIAAVTHAAGGKLVPVPGGVLVRDGEGELLGAIGISGDTSDNDEAAAVAGIEAAGLVAQT